MRYAVNHWDGLIMYLDDGRLEIDTNVVERQLRPTTLIGSGICLSRD
jgi:transposase